MTKPLIGWALAAGLALVATGCGCGAMAPAALQQSLQAASPAPAASQLPTTP